jgi:hypothetical protein
LQIGAKGFFANADIGSRGNGTSTPQREEFIMSMNRGGRNYTVEVSDTKRGAVVGNYAVTATSVKEAKALAVSAAIKACVVIDNSRLFARGPLRAD